VSALLDRAAVSRYVVGGSSLLAIGSRDVLFAGYYRSGTTWTRLVLANLIALNELDGRDVEPILNDVMPELGVNSLFRRWPYRTTPRVIKTHRRYSPLFGRARSFGIIRDPRDVMVSRYHKRHDRWQDFGSSFGAFIRDPRFGLEDWWAHYLSWRDHWLLTLRYEDLLADPQDGFGRLIDVLGVAPGEGTLEAAIDRTDFRRLQAAERRRNPDAPEGALHYRAGSAGQWARYFDDDDLAYYRSVAARYDPNLYP
jgi:hypothetical protein